MMGPKTMLSHTLFSIAPQKSAQIVAFYKQLQNHLPPSHTFVLFTGTLQLKPIPLINYPNFQCIKPFRQKILRGKIHDCHDLEE